MIQLQALVDWNFPKDIDYDEMKEKKFKDGASTR